MSGQIKIWGVPLSVHTRKVIVAARTKSIPYEVSVVIPVIPDNPPPHWRSLSPTGLIPAIDDGGYVLADSTAIVHYLERKVPEPALLPGRLDEYGRALFLDAWAGDVLFRRVVHPIFHNQVVSPKIHDRPGDPRAIDAALGTSGPAVFHYLGHRIDAARFPKLAAYFKRQVESSLWRAALEDEAPFARNMGLDRGF